MTVVHLLDKKTAVLIWQHSVRGTSCFRGSTSGRTVAVETNARNDDNKPAAGSQTGSAGASRTRQKNKWLGILISERGRERTFRDN